MVYNSQINYLFFYIDLSGVKTISWLFVCENLTSEIVVFYYLIYLFNNIIVDLNNIMYLPKI